jgi:hypothetical protein
MTMLPNLREYVVLTVWLSDEKPKLAELIVDAECVASV